MSAVWLLLYLGTLVHLLALNGYGLERKVALLTLLPVLALCLVGPLRRRLPGLFNPVPARIGGLLGFAGTLLLARYLNLAGWDVREPLPDALAALAGLGSLWAAAADEARTLPGPGDWVWIGAWMFAGFLDPALPMVGAGLAACLAAFGAWPGALPADPAQPLLARPGLAFFLVGLALPKAWWDYGPRPEWAHAGLALGLGAALSLVAPLRRHLARLPEAGLLVGLGLLFVLYGPAFRAPWGLLLGLLLGQAWARSANPFHLARLGGAWLAGLVLSFALHANVWLPGLRHLIWLGN